MSESLLSPGTPLDQPSKTGNEVDDKTMTLHEAVDNCLLRLLPIIEELYTRGFPAHLLDTLKQEWLTLDRVHKRTEQKD